MHTPVNSHRVMVPFSETAQSTDLAQETRWQVLSVDDLERLSTEPPVDPPFGWTNDRWDQATIDEFSQIVPSTETGKQATFMAVGNGLLLDLVAILPVDQQPDRVVHLDQNPSVLDAQSLLYARALTATGPEQLRRKTLELQPRIFYATRDLNIKIDGQPRGIFHNRRDFNGLLRWFEKDPQIALGHVDCMAPSGVESIAEVSEEANAQITFLNLTNVFEYHNRGAIHTVRGSSRRNVRAVSSEEVARAVTASVDLLTQLPLHPDAVIAESSTERIKNMSLNVVLHPSIKSYELSLLSALKSIQ